MTIRYLKNRRDGTIYEWDEILAANASVFEVTEEEAFPERFVPEKQRGRKAKVELATDEEDTLAAQLAETWVTPEQEAEASKTTHSRAKAG